MSIYGEKTEKRLYTELCPPCLACSTRNEAVRLLTGQARQAVLMFRGEGMGSDWKIGELTSLAQETWMELVPFHGEIRLRSD